MLEKFPIVSISKEEGDQESKTIYMFFIFKMNKSETL